MKSKVLILGGYGNFGKIISKALVQENIPIIIAGRSKDKAAQFVNILQRCYDKPNITTAILDINKDLNNLLKTIKPKVVINTCGPFQPIEQTNFKALQDCLECGVNYIDLADGRDFLRQINKFNNIAKQTNTTVITGASTAPGLSSALLQKFFPEFKSIQSVYYGFSPGQKSTRGGEATARGVMSYVGKQIKPYGRFTKPKYGWQDLYAQYYPGVGYRLMGNIDHPDFDIFPKKYGINNLHFHAGVQNKLLHLGIWTFSWLIRLGIPVNLPKYSNQLLKISHSLFNWLGSDIGVMHMIISGTNLKGLKFQKKWFLIARNSEGPNVATVPAILLANRIIKQDFSLPGVNPCVGLVSLDDYLSFLKKFNIETFSENKQI